MKCIDASFIIHLVINNEPDNIYNKYWQEWQNFTSVVVAPTLLMYEVSNALYRFKTASELEIQLYGDRFLHKEALKLASYYNLSATYDAHYLVLYEIPKCLLQMIPPSPPLLKGGWGEAFGTACSLRYVARIVQNGISSTTTS